MEGGKRRREEVKRTNACQGRQNQGGGCWYLYCLLITLVMMDSNPPGGTFLQEKPECQHQLLQRPMATAQGKVSGCWDVPAVTLPVLVSNGTTELHDLGYIHSGWKFLKETNPASCIMGKYDISDNMVVSRRKATSTQYECTNISSKESTSSLNVMISAQTSESEASLYVDTPDRIVRKRK